jgi:hypothetical protein
VHQHPKWQSLRSCSLPDGLTPFLQACRCIACRDSITSCTQQQQQQQDLHSAGRRCLMLLVIDFGSMGMMGLLPRPHELLRSLVAGLEAVQWRGVLLTGGWAPLEVAHATLSPAAAERLWLQPVPLTCHHTLLERSTTLLHHGGAGTTAAALAAGVTQLIAPLQFDQPQWAMRVAHLGCSPEEPLQLERLATSVDSSGNTFGGAYLAAALKAAATPQIMDAAAAVAASLTAEGSGLARAAALVAKVASI